MARAAAKKGRTQRKRNSHLVFVSHATYDKWIAMVLCEKLEHRSIGAQTFRDDRDISGGDSIPESIKEKIRQCDEVVVLLTPESVSRDWIKLEIGMAEILEKRIVPVFYHVDPEKLISILRDRRGFKLDELEDYLADVGKRVRSL